MEHLIKMDDAFRASSGYHDLGPSCGFSSEEASAAREPSPQTSPAVPKLGPWSLVYWLVMVNSG